ncbi:MAG: putative DNA-binding domain-containing protein [Myxococcota bacterium]
MSGGEERFERYLRARLPSPELPMPGAEVYRRLMRANMLAVIENAFPVARRILGEAGFAELFSEFLEKAGPKTPYYRQIPGDFAAWALATEHPLADLLDYEWVELVAARHPADVIPSAPERLTINPTLQIRIYGRPVHEMSAESPSPDPFEVPVAYMVWRRGDESVVFDRAGLIIARAVELLAEEPLNLSLLAARLQSETGLDVSAALRSALLNMRAREGLFASDAAF